MNCHYDRTRWEATWRQRMESVKAAFGPTEPPDQVRSFDIADPRIIVPGACAVTFAQPAAHDARLTISLGLSQPLDAESEGNPWEFGIYAPKDETWPAELLYDLVVGHASHPGWLAEGHCLPLTFFRNQNGELDCGSFHADAEPLIFPVGHLRSLYLWRDLSQRTSIRTEQGEFFVMVATGITEDEERAGDTTSPAHVLLVLREMQIGQVTDPHRRSIFELPGSREAWQRIRLLTHDEVLEQLGS